MTRRTLHDCSLVAALAPRAAAARAQDVALPEPVGRSRRSRQRRRRAGDRARRRSRDRSRQRRHLGRQGRHHRAGGAGDHHHHHRRRDQGARLPAASIEALGTVPGWIDVTAHRQPGRRSRWCAASARRALLLRDGVSLFDPWVNIAWLSRTQPLETIKRIEVVTGPGGVLWGANSFLGIVNVITKDAEDVNGLEVSRRLRRRPRQQAGLQAPTRCSARPSSTAS